MSTIADRPPFDPKPITLSGQHVQLEPLTEMHASDLYRIGTDATVWRYLSRPPFASHEDAAAWIAAACADVSTGHRIAFAIVDGSSRHVLGTTSYLDIQRPHRTLEIGWTWLAVTAQRTRANTECKFLLLGHAFETLGAIRVQFQTDRRNERSQRAIERIGAVREGVLRHHRLVRDGVIRDTVIYSVTDTEWESHVKAHLGRLARVTGPGKHAT